MKVALLSFHNAYNYGAALQAYALQCAVEKLGVECEYINYINEHRKNAYDMIFQLKSALKEKKWIRAIKVGIGIPFIGKRRRAFDKFYSKNLRKTTKIYRTSTEAKSLNDKYDCFIVGSDQVWNPENNGADTAFLLDFVNDSKKKISYSSSFGLSDIPEEFVDKYKKNLSDFSSLAVREEQGVELVKSLTGKIATLVLDPVFLAGIDTWDSLRKTDQWTQNKKYVFFYTNKPTQVDDFLMTGYKMTDLEKHILSSHVTPADFISRQTKVCSSMTPERFLNEVANAELVVTASFHCLAFAIIFHKQFCVLLSGDYGKDERMLSLLKICGLEDRVFNINTSVADIEKKIDYSVVEKKLALYCDSSKDYLKHVLFKGEYKQNPVNQKKYFCSDSRCTGCAACAYACPVNAIRMCKNEEGFEIPVRDAGKCIDCGKCTKVCQIYSKNNLSVEKQAYYAAKNQDDVRMQSSSGGCFTAFSDYILKDGGVICAATMDENFKVKHLFATDKEQRNKMRKTFYVQSSIKGCYGKIATYLKNNEKVFFVGTPCQVSGIKHVFGDNENLFTCDIVCHGVPSPLAFEKFIDYLKEKGNLTRFSFRDKEYGYKGYTASAQYGDKKIGKKLWLNSFTNMFSHNMVNRLSCASCKYNNYNRPGDVTIGDFWGVEKSHPELIDNKGISLLIVNSEKGKKLLNRIDDLSLTNAQKKETVQNSLKKSASVSNYRYQAMRTIVNENYEKSAKKYGEYNVKGLVKEFLRGIINV